MPAPRSAKGCPSALAAAYALSKMEPALRPVTSDVRRQTHVESSATAIASVRSAARQRRVTASEARCAEMPGSVSFAAARAFPRRLWAAMSPRDSRHGSRASTTGDARSRVLPASRRLTPTAPRARSARSDSALRFMGHACHQTSSTRCWVGIAVTSILDAASSIDRSAKFATAKNRTSSPTGTRSPMMSIRDAQRVVPNVRRLAPP